MADNREVQIRKRFEARDTRRAAGDYKKVPAGPAGGVTTYPKKVNPGEPQYTARNLGTNSITLSEKRSPYTANPDLYRDAVFNTEFMLFGTKPYLRYYIFDAFGITDFAVIDAILNDPSKNIGINELSAPTPQLLAFINSTGQARQNYLVAEKAKDESADNEHALLYELAPYFASLIRKKPKAKGEGAAKTTRGMTLQQKLDKHGDLDVSSLGKPGKTPGAAVKYAPADPSKAFKKARVGNTRLYSSNERGARLALAQLGYSPDAVEREIALWHANQGNLARAPAAAAAAPLAFVPSSVASPGQNQVTSYRAV
jgi:hypothetical protein